MNQAVQGIAFGKGEEIAFEEATLDISTLSKWVDPGLVETNLTEGTIRPYRINISVRDRADEAVILNFRGEDIKISIRFIPKEGSVYRGVISSYSVEDHCLLAIDEVVLEADRRGLLSDEHFTVDGTLIEAAASLKSFKPKDGDPPKKTDDDPGNPSVDMENDVAMPPIRAPRTRRPGYCARGKAGKGKEANLVFMAHALMENRHGLLVDFQTTQATGTAERDTVPVLVDQAKERGFHPKTLGGDKGYDTGDCVAALRQRGLTPHVAQNTNGRSSAIDGRTTRHPGYAISQRIRKRVEEIFGWMKTVGGFRRTRYKGLDRTGLAGYLVATAYNLVRMAKLLELAKEAPEAQAA